MNLTGYKRTDGRVGIRNHVLVMSSVACANRVVDMIAAQIPAVIPITHQHGCAQIGRDNEQTERILAGFGKHPNVASVLLVGLGCETLPPERLASQILPSGKRVETLTIQAAGGTLKAASQGCDLARELLDEAAAIEREPITMEAILLGTECGGSDTTSGLAANPAVGAASDWVVAEGGSVILSETTELIGTEHLLAKRAKNEEVAKRIAAIISAVEDEARRMGTDIRGGNPTPGNILGGITSIEEKALGCIYKAGTGTIQQVVDYGEAPTEKGLVIMDTPGHDIESITGMIAGGAQLIVFTTGRGTPAGAPIAPVVKITANPETARSMADHIDLDVSQVLTGQISPEEAGRRIVEIYAQCINGAQTKAEILGHREFAINRIGKSM